MLLPAPCSVLSAIGRCLGDAVQRQVVDVDVAVRGTPGEGERGGVGRSDGQITDGSRTWTTNRDRQDGTNYRL